MDENKTMNENELAAADLSNAEDMGFNEADSAQDFSFGDDSGDTESVSFEEASDENEETQKNMQELKAGSARFAASVPAWSLLPPSDAFQRAQKYVKKKELAR